MSTSNITQLVNLDKTTHELADTQHMVVLELEIMKHDLDKIDKAQIKEAIDRLLRSSLDSANLIKEIRIGLNNVALSLNSST